MGGGEGGLAPYLPSSLHQVTVKQFQPILVLSITISPVLSFDVKAMLLVRILP